MSRYVPPFTITAAILNQVVEIAELLGHWAAQSGRSSPLLRKNTVFVLFRRRWRLSITA
ncbi:UNVERIFIED_ORG: hypothetical protein J2S99_004050 [Atlantibacter hermannii]|nr:hypothetical protein [Atlantibacter hermannii]